MFLTRCASTFQERPSFGRRARLVPATIIDRGRRGHGDDGEDRRL